MLSHINLGHSSNHGFLLSILFLHKNKTEKLRINQHQIHKLIVLFLFVNAIKVIKESKNQTMHSYKKNDNKIIECLFV